MKISVQDTDRAITEFRIRHKGTDLNFSWICKNTSRRISLGEFSIPNCCEICIDDFLELENLLYMLDRAKKEMCGIIGRFE